MPLELTSVSSAGSKQQPRGSAALILSLSTTQGLRRKPRCRACQQRGDVARLFPVHLYRTSFTLWFSPMSTTVPLCVLASSNETEQNVQRITTSSTCIKCANAPLGQISPSFSAAMAYVWARLPFVRFHT